MADPVMSRGGLDASLADLAGLVTGSLGLQELLTKVADLAARIIPGTDGAGLLLCSDAGMGTTSRQVAALAASAPFVAELESLQNEICGEGPAVTATLERRTVCTGSLPRDPSWPRLGPRAGRLGVHSALAMPLLVPGQVVGALSLYARDRDVFDARAASVGELFAGPAAVAVHHAQVLAQARELTGQLQNALTSRPIIDQAIGILRARTGASTDEALLKLRRLSQAGNTKLATVAQHLVDEAVRRARARSG